MNQITLTLIVFTIFIIAFLSFLSDKIKENTEGFGRVAAYLSIAIITIAISLITSHLLEPIVDEWIKILKPTPSVPIQSTSVIETPKLTAARESIPTATLKPTATPKPIPTATPKPTATPRPTATPKPTSTPRLTATPMPTTIGDTFKFGHYEQDNDTSNGKERIQWEVLDCDKSNNRILVLSVKGLHTMKYHKNNNKTAWGDTSVRNWLNGSFLESFSSKEKDMIIKTNISGSSDYCFLLDATQVKKYLKKPYLCKATKKAKMEGAYINSGYSSWLVRTDVTKKKIAWVGGAGKLYTPEDNTAENYMTSKDNVVRPAMWLKINP